MKKISMYGPLLGGILALASCAALPEAGPSTKAVTQGSLQANTPPGDAGYKFVTLTEQDAIALNQNDVMADEINMNSFTELPAVDSLGLIGPGDLLRITLWEPNPTGATLLTAPGLDVSLRVDPSGDILLPYVGQLRVAGRTPMSISRMISSIFNVQGHDIQVAALDTDQTSSTAIVEGDVGKPGEYPVSYGARDILSLIAIAGGALQPDYATTVRLRRGGAMGQAPLTEIIENPRLDVDCQPGDSVMLLPRRLFFYAFGAVNRPGLFPYDGTKVTLTQALANIAGLQDNLAAPRGVFIFRRTLNAPAQTVYQLDLSKAESFFVADLFVLQPGDIIYVSNAPVADVTKVLQTISGASSIAVVPRNFGANY